MRLQFFISYIACKITLPRQSLKYKKLTTTQRRVVRGAWYAVLKDGPEILNGPVDLPGHPAYKELSGHVAHCFDYIRQSLMCSGDSTMEAFLEADGKTLRQQGSSGWGVEHKCVDFEALGRWTENFKDPGP